MLHAKPQSNKGAQHYYDHHTSHCHRFPYRPCFRSRLVLNPYCCIQQDIRKSRGNRLESPGPVLFHLHPIQIFLVHTIFFPLFGDLCSGSCLSAHGAAVSLGRLVFPGIFPCLYGCPCRFYAQAVKGLRTWHRLYPGTDLFRTHLCPDPGLRQLTISGTAKIGIQDERAIFSYGHRDEITAPPEQILSTTYLTLS